MNVYETAVYNTAINNEVSADVALLIVSQARHESANFSSNVFKQNNNAFGYKYVGQSGASQGTAAPSSEGGYYAKYDSLEDSALEVVNWWKRRIRQGVINDWSDIATPDSYALALKKAGYYGDSLANYTAALKTWLKGLDLGNEMSFVSVAFVLFIFYYLFK
ncbi:MAG: glucosaminidase domain-containing protein [Chitinophagaceae bacterium]|nr:glucosaminidase domain-containing protein [Chitinophagaceae bacterium]